MIPVVVGCSFRNAPVEVRERLAFDEAKISRALSLLSGERGMEAVVLSTCNRVELYLAADRPAAELVRETTAFLAEFHGLSLADVNRHVYAHADADAVRHLFRVGASLDSLIVGEGQIAGQVRKSYERALAAGATGPLLNALFPHARQVAKKVRSDTGISQGSVSVSSAAVEYVRQVFDHFGDKTVLVIGAGKMGELTLKHLKGLEPGRVLVTNRSPEKAVALAATCGGEAVPFASLDEAINRADIVLSTTGAPEPIMPKERFAKIAAKRTRGPLLVLDIALPRDFDPNIHDGDSVSVFNIDDLKNIRERTLARRREHVAAAENIVEQEAAKFRKEWARRRHGPAIALLRREFDAKRRKHVEELLVRLNGKVSQAEQELIAKAFDRFQNDLLHDPQAALKEESGRAEPTRLTMLEAMMRLFRLKE